MTGMHAPAKAEVSDHSSTADDEKDGTARADFCGASCTSESAGNGRCQHPCLLSVNGAREPVLFCVVGAAKNHISLFVLLAHTEGH